MATTTNTQPTIHKLSCNIGAILIIYTIARFAGMLAKEAVIALTGTSSDRMAAICGEYAGYMLGIIVVMLIMRKKVSVRDVFSGGEKVTPMILLLILVFHLAVLFPAELLNDAMKLITKLFGASLQESANNVEGRNKAFTFSEMLLAGIIGPVVEELIYRGFIMRRLESHGKVFAVVTSAILFGLMHGNPIQLISASLTGLVYGYVTMRFGIKWSMLLHCFHNLILVHLISVELGRLTGTAAMELILTALMLVCFVIAVMYALRHRAELKAPVSGGETAPKSSYFRIYISIPMIIFILYCFWRIAGEFR